MRFNCGPTWSERVTAKSKWHRWFAWHPVRMTEGDRHDCRWLEVIERKGDLCWGDWDYAYRAIK